MVNEKQLRLFVAVELPKQIKAALATEIERLKQELGPHFRWVPAANMHLTLKFLGDVDDGRAGQLGEALTRAVRQLPPLRLTLVGAGTFPSGREPSVIWAGLGGDVEALTALHSAVETSLTAAGEAPDTRKFQPHLTLARLRGRLSGSERLSVNEDLTRLLSQVRYPDGASFEVRGVSLVRSKLGPDGASYTTLVHAPLAER